jgi:hypothetical protein
MTNAVKPKSLIHSVKRILSDISLVEFALIRLEWNGYNGLIFKIFGLEFQGNKHNFEGDLIGLHISTNYVIVYLLYISFEIKSPVY